MQKSNIYFTKDTLLSQEYLKVLKNSMFKRIEPNQSMFLKQIVCSKIISDKGTYYLPTL